jgi:hypothetical protein
MSHNTRSGYRSIRNHTYTQAGQYQTGTGTFAGQPTNMMGAQDLVGPNAYQQFMSPYQQDVIDATLSEYDKQAQKLV